LSAIPLIEQSDACLSRGSRRDVHDQQAIDVEVDTPALRAGFADA
jgi:hypothetical protein